MKKYCFTIDCDSHTYAVTYVTREYKYPVGKQCPEGKEFIQALGMWDNFSVALGQNVEAWTSKPRERLLNACENLLARVQTDGEYIGYDYQCGFAAEGRTRHSGRGFGVRLPGKDAFIWLHPGQIFMEFSEQRKDGNFHVVETIDLRRSGPIQTENLGQLKVYGRSNPITWELKLLPLIHFLRSHSCEYVRVRHHYRNE